MHKAFIGFGESEVGEVLFYGFPAINFGIWIEWAVCVFVDEMGHVKIAKQSHFFCLYEMCFIDTMWRIWRNI